MIDSMKNAFCLKDKVAIITGGDTGIGFGIATAMAEQGANIAIFCRRQDRAEEALAILKRNVPEKTGLLSSLEGRKELTKADFERLMDRRDEILDVCFDVISLDKQQADIISGIRK